MMKLLLSGVTAAALIAIVPAIAQPAPPPAPGVAPGTAPVPGAPHIEMHVQRMEMPETRGAVVAHVRELFARADTNRDGFVTRAEVDALHKGMAMGTGMGTRTGDMHHAMAGGDHMPPLPHLDPAAMFDRLDANRDGMISRQEFMARPPIEERRMIVMHDGKGEPGMPPMPEMQGMMHMHAMGTHMSGKMFESADANHDGRVSLQEMTAMALSHFDQADTNHDGRLSPDERMQMHHRMMDHRPA